MPIKRTTTEDLNLLRKIPKDKWHRFGVEYKSLQTLSNGAIIGGTLSDNRRFTLCQKTNRFIFLSK